MQVKIGETTMNYELEFEKTIARLPQNSVKPTLLLHSCCGPCSSAVLERLLPHFRLIVYYCNPNIYPQSEYTRRFLEQRDFLQKLAREEIIDLIEEPYQPDDFYQAVKGFEHIPEGGERCFRCYELRQRQAARKAKELGVNFFTTTLSVSPHKNAQKLNEIGLRLAEEFQIPYLCSDFKKKNGYKRSLELSQEYDLYRQDYCGCQFSRQERLNYLNTKQLQRPSHD